MIFTEISGLESDGVAAGTDATFTCSYTTLTQTATAQWYKVVSDGEDSEVTGFLIGPKLGGLYDGQPKFLAVLIT